jgi:proteasome alpha subunit
MAQVYTQHAGVRPFGVSTILAGVDNTGSRILTTDPSGAYRGYKATAVGRKNEDANMVLEKKYSDTMTIDESISLAIEAVKVASSNEISSSNIKVAIIPTETKIFRRLSQEEVEKHIT